MPDKLTQTSVELRAQIARSRCRLDRQLFQWSDDTFWFRRAGDMIRSTRTRPWWLALGAVYFAARWIGGSTAQRQENGAWSTTTSMSSFLDRCARYLRVLAWKTRRASRDSDAESGHE